MSRVKCVVLGDGLMTREILGERFRMCFSLAAAEGVLEKKLGCPPIDSGRRRPSPRPRPRISPPLNSGWRSVARGIFRARLERCRVPPESGMGQMPNIR